MDILEEQNIQSDTSSYKRCLVCLCFQLVYMEMSRTQVPVVLKNVIPNFRSDTQIGGLNRILAKMNIK